MQRGRPPTAKKITRTCQQCGKQWEAYEYDNKVFYCSRQCFYASRVGRKRELDPSEKEQRACLRCGKMFVVGGGGNRPRIAKYCSRTCSKVGYWAAVRSGKLPPPARASFDGATHDEAKEMTELERVWLAATLDCEGCIGWPRRHVLHSVYLTVTNTNKKLIDRIAEITGTGRVKSKLQKPNPRHSPTWTWNCYGDNARSILRQTMPWLIVKREAAEVVLGLSNATEPPWTQRTKSMRAVQ